MNLESERERCSHLLRRFGLGASETELDYYMKDGLSGAIDLLLDDKSDDGYHLEVERLANEKGNLPVPSAINWWVARMLVTQCPLREKMTLFWHNHFATSLEKVTAPRMMVEQNEILRSNALGNFRTLLSSVSKDPAMILWLDNQENVRGHANENFAREVMELFTLGIGHYTEHDVQEGARAFTGWSLHRLGSKKLGGKRGSAEFLFRSGVHDEGTKTFLGNTANLSGEDVLNILCDQPQTATYIVTKLWDWFVWPKPDPATIAPYARRFQESGLDIKALLRDVMKSSDFYSAKAVRSILKHPVDFCVATMRQNGLGSIMGNRLKDVPEGPFPRSLMGPAQVAQISMKAMGMWLMYPPDVSGWRTGEYWITSATMVERIGWADKILGNARSGRINLPYNAYGLFSADPSPQGVVKRLLSIFDAPVRETKAASMISVARGTMTEGLTPANANAVAANVTRLIFASPEFQFS